MPRSLPRTKDAMSVQAVRAGDAAAFGALVDRYARAAYAVAYIQLRNHHDAEDAVQDAFIAAYRRLDSLRITENFGPWLLTIVRNQSTDRLRKRGREIPLDLEEETAPGPAADLREEVARNDTRHAMQTGLAAVTGVHAEVLTLHYFAGMSIAEIAGLLDLPIETIKKRLQRARAELGDHDALAEFAPAAARDDRRRAAILAAILALALPAAPGAHAASPAGASPPLGVRQTLFHVVRSKAILLLLMGALLTMAVFYGLTWRAGHVPSPPPSKPSDMGYSPPAKVEESLAPDKSAEKHPVPSKSGFKGEK